MYSKPVPVAFAVTLLVATSLPAQCGIEWLPGSGFAGTDGTVRESAMWDPDGPGPDTPRLVIAGGFEVVRDRAIDGIAMWDPVTDTWSDLGADGATVRDFATSSNGTLYAARTTLVFGALQVHSVDRWNGSAWEPLGAGFNSVITNIEVLANGDVVATGNFTIASGVPASRMARWNGASWSEFAGGSAGPVNDLEALPNGDVLAAVGYPFPVDDFDVIRWDGSSWTTLGTGFDDDIFDVAILPNGDLLAAGTFDLADGVACDGVAQWNGTSWSAVGSLPSNDRIVRLLVHSNGTIYGGMNDAPGLVAWDGSSWNAADGGVDAVTQPLNEFVGALEELPNGDVFVGGTFEAVGSTPLAANHIARWNGSAWSAFGAGIDGDVTHFLGMSNGDYVVAGTFTSIDGVPARRIARWDGVSWSPLGNGIGSSVRALAELPDGSPVVALSEYVFRWDGATWVSLGVPSAGGVRDLVVLPNGDLIAGLYGGFGVRRWDGGVSWSVLAGGLNGSATTLAVLGDGDLIVGGSFTMAGGVPAEDVARWDGVSWAAVGQLQPLNPGILALIASVDVIQESAAGELVVDYTVSDLFAIPPGNYRERQIWNGVEWNAVPPSSPYSADIVRHLPGGDPVARSPVTGNLARWQANAWQDLQPPVAIDSQLFVDRDGQIALIGGTSTDGNTVANGFARVRSTCAATASSLGNGCVGQLDATSLPWLGSTFEATANGIQAPAIVLAATGLGSYPQGAFPLGAVFVEALPGCDLLVDPDVNIEAIGVVSGPAVSTFELPPLPFLAGLPFYHQMVVFELDAQGDVSAITSTNALQLTAGFF